MERRRLSSVVTDAADADNAVASLSLVVAAIPARLIEHRLIKGAELEEGRVGRGRRWDLVGKRMLLLMLLQLLMLVVLNPGGGRVGEDESIRGRG